MLRDKHMSLCIRLLFVFSIRCTAKFYIVFTLRQMEDFIPRDFSSRQIPTCPKNPQNPPPPNRRHWWSWQCPQRRSCVWCPLCPWKWRRRIDPTRRPVGVVLGWIHRKWGEVLGCQTFVFLVKEEHLLCPQMVGKKVQVVVFLGFANAIKFL